MYMYYIVTKKKKRENRASHNQRDDVRRLLFWKHCQMNFLRLQTQVPFWATVLTYEIQVELIFCNAIYIAEPLYDIVP